MSCLGNVNNYANLLNGVNLKNTLTCSFTWLYLEAVDKLIFGDQTTIPAGDPIVSIDIEVLDGVTTALGSGTASAPIEVDTSSLDALKIWRINYSVETVSGCTCSVSIFISPFVPEVITGTSDPNELPLPFSTLVPNAVSPHPVQIYEQDFTAVSTWNVTHNTGFPDPLSIEIYRNDGARIFAGRSNITANAFDIVFSNPLSGSVKVISKV